MLVQFSLGSLLGFWEMTTCVSLHTFSKISNNRVAKSYGLIITFLYEQGV